MCSAPKPQKVQDIPQRAMAMLPDNGDPAIRNSLRNPRRLTLSAMAFANRGGNIGAPMTSAPSTTAAI